MQTLFVGIASWIIQDGNYGDFRVGEEPRFALEFYAHSLEVAASPTAVADRVKGSLYRIKGRVAETWNSVWVLDLGVLAYQNSQPPRAAQAGKWVEGMIELGIDPFLYFEDLIKLPGMPELRYHWRLRGIWLETTPRLSNTDERGTTTICRDEKNESFIPVAETNAWEDDGGNAHYLLECERIG
jgi:hypothetical protein